MGKENDLTIKFFVERIRKVLDGKYENESIRHI